MAIARITNQGLRWIATLVTVLWVCLLLEASIVRHARADVQQSLAELRLLRGAGKPAPQPVSLPVYPFRTARSTAG